MALWSFAVAQPLYDLLGPNPEFFIEHGMGRLGLAFFVVGLSALMPLAMALAVEAIQRLNKRLGALLRLACLTGLSIALGAIITARIDSLPGPLATLAAVLLGIGIVVACYRLTAAHGPLFWVAVASLFIFPALFFLSAPAIRGLWLPTPGVESPHGGTGAPIVILIFDELPLASLLDEHDNIEAGRFPNFARLARTSTWFRNTTSIAASTEVSIASLLTSSWPRPSTAPVAAEYPRNLFTALRDTYDMHVVERVTRLCPPELCSPLTLQPDVSPVLSRDLALAYLHLMTPEVWRSRLPAIDQTWTGFGSATTSGKSKGSRPAAGSGLDPRIEPPHMLRHFIAGMKPRPSPTLHYLHLMLPHIPWKYLPSGQEYARPERMNTRPGMTAKGTPLAREWEVVQAYQRHLLQVQFTDRLLGQLLDALEQHGLFDETLLIFAADHGASFALGVKRRGGYDGVNVPLMVKLPGQKEGRIDNRFVTLLDVLPTVLGAVQLTTDWRMEGKPLTAEPATGRDEEALAKALRVSRARKTTVQRKLTWFPSFADPDGLFRIGPHLELIGSRPEHWPTATDSLLPPIEFDRAWFFADVDPTGPFIPAYISGRLVAPPEEHGVRQLAIAVNGRIASVTRTTGGDNAEFSAMVEPTAFAQGSNQVDVYQVVVGPPLSLARLQDVSGRHYRLTSTEDQALLFLPSGERVRVRSEAQKNFNLRRDLRAFVITGRLDLGPNNEVPLALLFDGTKAIGPIPVDPDRATRPEFRWFQLRFSLSLAPDPSTLRVLIVRGASAQRQELRQ